MAEILLARLSRLPENVLNLDYVRPGNGISLLRFLEMFKSDHCADVSLHQWLALTPPELVQAHFHLNQKVMGALQREKRPVV